MIESRLNLFGMLTVVIGLAVGSSDGFAQPAPSGCAIAGPDDAPITIEEYSDFECPYCARGYRTMERILREYPGKIKLVYRNMPLPFHAHALPAAKAFASVCKQNLGLAYLYQQELFVNQPELTTKGAQYLYELAEKLGVNLDKMKLDMNSPDIAKSLAADQAAVKSHGFDGTPSFMVGTEPVTGSLPFADFKKIIDRQLAR